MARRSAAEIKRALTEPERMARFVLATLAVANAGWAVSMVMLNDVIYRYAWPVWFGIGAIACAYAAIHLTQHAAAVAGAATLTAITGRAIALAWSWSAGHLYGQPAAQSMISLIGWIVIAILTGVLFFRGVLRITARSA